MIGVVLDKNYISEGEIVTHDSMWGHRYVVDSIDSRGVYWLELYEKVGNPSDFKPGTVLMIVQSDKKSYKESRYHSSTVLSVEQTKNKNK